MAPRTNKAVESASVEAPVDTEAKVFWLDKAELESFATMAVTEGLSEEEAFQLFDNDAQGFHFNGSRVNASTFKYQYNLQYRRAEMTRRIASATKRQG